MDNLEDRERRSEFRLGRRFLFLRSLIGTGDSFLLFTADFDFRYGINNRSNHHKVSTRARVKGNEREEREEREQITLFQIYVLCRFGLNRADTS